MSPQRRYLNRKQRELNTLRGIPNRVDATQARSHLAKLRRTMGWNAIAAATRCSACHLRYIADGRTTTINRVTHERILATQPAPAPTAGLYINATGTRRRVHALQAIGYSQEAIARAAGTTQHRICVVSLGAERVRQKFADKIAAAYSALAHTPPAETRFTRRACRQAAERGWPDPQFWDDVDRIDDPTFDPTPVLTEVPRYVRLAEDALWLQEQGFNRQQIGQRLGEDPDYVAASIRRYHRAATLRNKVAA